MSIIIFHEGFAVVDTILWVSVFLFQFRVHCGVGDIVFGVMFSVHHASGLMASFLTGWLENRLPEVPSSLVGDISIGRFPLLLRLRRLYGLVSLQLDIFFGGSMRHASFRDNLSLVFFEGRSGLDPRVDVPDFGAGDDWEDEVCVIEWVVFSWERGWLLDVDLRISFRSASSFARAATCFCRSAII